MIKMLVSARKIPSLTDQEYSDYWGVNHGALVRRYGQDMGFRRYIQVHTLPIALPGALTGTEGPDIPKNGQAELWWNSVEAMLDAGTTEEGRAASLLFEEDEKRFCDVSNLSAFLAEETILLDLDPTTRFGIDDVKLVVDLWAKTDAPAFEDWLVGHVAHFDAQGAGAGLNRYIVNRPLADDRFDFARARGWKPAPDASIEMWFADRGALERALSSNLGERWKADVSRFADIGRLRPLIGSPRVIFDAEEAA